MKRVGILFGMEDTFPWALIGSLNEHAKNGIVAEAVEISHLSDCGKKKYDLILDRISHEVPFYRTWLKCAVFQGTRVINSPFWWSADDKFFDNLVAGALGVAVPRTALLPHKNHPPNTTSQSFRNLRFVDWDEVFAYLGFPIFLKPAYGGGWKDVYRCDDRTSFFNAYDQTRDLCMMAQEAIEFTEYYRCYVLGRSRVHIMRYDPTQPHALRYVQNPPPMNADLRSRVEQDALALCKGLGYDMNTVEFAVREGVPYAIDFMNCAPDADLHSVGKENFDWVVTNMTEVLVECLNRQEVFEPTGEWPLLRARGAEGLAGLPQC
ncbi:MAG TPA: hypothetical protein VE398_07950 [Acidobacteriota bacterium]|nr:hypothetical protein [Acidobacteriota bacterium]